uniref:Uncharacterized protein n=1 Tax=Anguilla anguilla TaxID=7936 RepID=A0A0E9QRH5_ANGAN
MHWAYIHTVSQISLAFYLRMAKVRIWQGHNMILFTIANASLWGTVGGASLSHVPSCPNPPGQETQEVQCLIFCSVRQLIPKTIQIAMPSV